MSACEGNRLADTGAGRAPSSIPWSRPWRLAAVVLALYYLAFLVGAVVERRGLVADGVWYLLQMVQYGGFALVEPTRLCAQILVQWPVVLALRLGIHDFDTLSVIHSFGLYYLNLLSLVIAWAVLPRDWKAMMAFPILSVVFGQMTSAYAAVAESRVLSLMFWPMAFAVLFVRIRDWRSAMVPLALALPSLLMYESMVFLGVVLAGMARHRCRGETRAAVRVYWAAIAGWFVLGSLVALVSIIFARDPTSRSGFIASLVDLQFAAVAWDQLNPPFFVALGGLILMGLCWWRPGPLARRLPLWFGGAVSVFLVLGLSPVLFPATFAPNLQFNARTWMAVVPALLVMPLVGVLSGRLRVPERARPMMTAVVAAVAFAQITWQIGSTLQWHGYLDLFRSTLAQESGLVTWEQSGLARRTVGRQTVANLAWPWTTPAMSIVLAPRGQVTTIIANAGRPRWQPFDPAQPDQLPRIPGISYQRYLDQSEGQ